MSDTTTDANVAQRLQTEAAYACINSFTARPTRRFQVEGEPKC